MTTGQQFDLNTTRASGLYFSQFRKLQISLNGAIRGIYWTSATNFNHCNNPCRTLWHTEIPKNLQLNVVQIGWMIQRTSYIPICTSIRQMLQKQKNVNIF